MFEESSQEDAFHSPVKKPSFFSPPPFSVNPPAKKSSAEGNLPDLFLSQNGPPSAKSGNQNFKVCVRVRPLIPREQLSGGNTCLEISPNQRTVQICKPSPVSLLSADSNPRTLVKPGANENSLTREHTFSFDNFIFVMRPKSVFPSQSPLSKQFKSPMLDKTKAFASPFKRTEIEKDSNISQKDRENLNSLLAEEDSLNAEIKLLKTRLSKLERIKLYKEKLNSPEFGDLKVLTTKWLTASQEIIPILAAKFKTRDPDISIPQLLTAWKIPLSLVRYNEEDEDFY